MTPPPRLVCIPRRDATFAAHANQVAARIPVALSEDAALAWFAVELCRLYPTAVVRKQTDLARGERTEVIWYATLRGHPFRIDLTIHVPLPPTRAFDVYVGRVTEWQTAVALTPTRISPELVGTEYEATYRLLGHTYRGTFRVLAAERPRRITLEASGSGISLSYTTTFDDGGREESHASPGEGGTIVRVQGDYSLPDTLLARVADRLGLERAIARDIERANEAYLRLCESIVG